jgi:hypothetical protein
LDPEYNTSAAQTDKNIENIAVKKDLRGASTVQLLGFTVPVLS